MVNPAQTARDNKLSFNLFMIIITSTSHSCAVGPPRVCRSQKNLIQYLDDVLFAPFVLNGKSCEFCGLSFENRKSLSNIGNVAVPVVQRIEQGFPKP